MPPPPAGPRLPFVDPGAPAPTAIVTAAPSFVTRFAFDPRVTAAPTETPAPPSPATATTFRGGYQPYVAPAASGTATPAPNTNLVVFTSTSSDLARLTSPTPTPVPTLSTRLIAPSLTLATPAPTPAPTFVILRPLDVTLVTPTPTPAPTQLILRSLAPFELLSPTRPRR